MAKFKIQVDTEVIKKKIEATEQQIKQGVEQGLRVCASEIKQTVQLAIEQTTGNGSYTPTGQLKRSVTILPLEWSPYGASITVVPMASYAQYVEQGTGIYNPQGRQTPWCYSPDGGNTFFFTRGIPSHHFVSDTHEFYKDKAPAIIKEQIYKCMK